MKEKFEEVSIQIVEFETEDVITTSPGDTPFVPANE